MSVDVSAHDGNTYKFLRESPSGKCVECEQFCSLQNGQRDACIFILLLHIGLHVAILWWH